MFQRPFLFAALLSTAGCLLDPNGTLPDGGIASCEPETTLCANANKNCGAITVTDRCGKTVTAQCGNCAGTMTCGGAGTANVCGATCPGGCPTGFSCSVAGVCAGGSSSSLTLDVKTLAVSGVVTLNGAAPQVGVGCSTVQPTSSMVTLSFVDLETGTNVTSYVPCSATNFAFNTLLAPGTYRVSVSPYTTDRSNLPSGSMVVDAAFKVTAAVTNAVLDVKSVPVSGTVTLNGATPLVGVGCSTVQPTSSMVTLSFLEAATGSSVTTYVPCSSTGFAFSTQLAPGTWQVSVSPYTTDRTNLPSGAFVVNTGLAVTGATTGAVLDVKTVSVSGSVTLNGSAPQVGVGCSTVQPTSSMTTLTFIETTNGTVVTHYIPCNATTFAFNTVLAPGTYRASVQPYTTDRTNLPNGTFVVNSALAVTADTTGVALEVKTAPVSGTLTLNGAAPQVGVGCSTVQPTSSMVTLNFAETTSLSRVTAYVPCSSTTFAFDTVLSPGTWRVVAGPYTTDRSNLPSGTFVVNPGLVVSAATTGVPLDLKTVPVSGTVTLNGATPQVGVGCSTVQPTSSMVTLSFNDSTAPLTFSFLAALRALPTTSATAYITCASTGFTFISTLQPGTYRIGVAPYTTDRSNLPAGTFVVTPRLEIK